MDITKINREQAEAAASETQIALYSSPESGQQMWNIALNFSLTKRETYYIFAEMIGDVILGFYNQQEILALIQQKFPQLNQMQQLDLELAIKKFLLPLSGGVSRTAELQSEISAAENDLRTIEGLRTMAADIQAVHANEQPTYKSSQAEILNRTETQSVSAPVVQPSSPSNRWDTDSRP